ncbi:DapH/DapD/GlmU-related protein [uncultured Enterococcus sp.]|uniref:acyltransferase n=1 Tax=uncultured Enterococcus sp. TaxID=167972 RepID=UPI00261F5A0E|nr:acyltransferase [uncultured Enterococcus sp.]
MKKNNYLWLLYHFLWRRDIVPKYYFKKGNIGKNVILYKPKFIDRKKDYIYIGDNSTILNGARIQSFYKITGYKSKVVVGKNCFFGYNISILAGEDIIIGNGVLIASDVLITSGNHGMNPETEKYYSEQPLVCKKVIIEEGCWIGEKVCILPGVKIGKKSIIGAGSVVTKEIPPYSIAVGSPARVIKRYDFISKCWR